MKGRLPTGEPLPTADHRGARAVTVSGDVSDSSIFTGDNFFQTGAPALTALHQLRAPVGDFVGREQEIETLCAALRQNNRASISGISGMGGIGKTELALLVAQRLTDEYPDAQFFINLQGTDPNPRSPQEVMGICIRAFRGTETRLPEDPDQLAQLFLSELSGKRVLLLLDNAADSTQVRPLVPPPGSALLVTSRQAITLPGMAPLTLHPLTDKEARELLLEIAPHATAAAEEICRLCGCLPLAIRAAGSLLAVTPDLDPIEYAEQLKDERNRLGLIGTEGVDLDVAASLNLSYLRLSDDAARVFRLLSVFPVTFDAVAEEKVCGDKGHAELSNLRRRSLVVYDTGTKRYRLHDLARLFADAKLTEEERAACQLRYAIHYKDVLAAADKLYLQGGEALALGLALFDLEWANIQAGHAWVAEHGADAGQDIARLSIEYPNSGIYMLSLRQHSRDRIKWLEIALAGARKLNHRVHEGNVLGNLGNAYTELGKPQRAIQFYEEALFIYREAGDAVGEGISLANLGLAYSALGELRRAVQFYQLYLPIARETGNRRGEGTVLGNLGLAYVALGETDRAVHYNELFLAIAREIGDRRAEGTALGYLGSTYAAVGETERAIELHEQRLAIARELGDRRNEAHTLGNLGNAHENRAQPQLAIRFYEEQLIIVREIGDRLGECRALSDLGGAYANLGETERAIQLYEAALLMDREIGDRRGEAIDLWNMSLVFAQLGNLTQAIQLAEDSVTIFEQLEVPIPEPVRAQLNAWRDVASGE